MSKKVDKSISFGFDYENNIEIVELIFNPIFGVN